VGPAFSLQLVEALEAIAESKMEIVKMEIEMQALQHQF
jgi:hypothetical protein